MVGHPIPHGTTLAQPASAALTLRGLPGVGAVRFRSLVDPLRVPVGRTRGALRGVRRGCGAARGCRAAWERAHPPGPGRHRAM